MILLLMILLSLSKMNRNQVRTSASEFLEAGSGSYALGLVFYQFSHALFPQLEVSNSPVITGIHQGSLNFHNVFLELLHTAAEVLGCPLHIFLCCWQKILVCAFPISHHFPGGEATFQAAQICQKYVELS